MTHGISVHTPPRAVDIEADKLSQEQISAMVRLARPQITTALAEHPMPPLVAFGAGT